MSTVREIPFGCPADTNGYSPFAEDFSGPGNLLFHGTSEDRAISIIQNGFAPTGELRSSSFAKSAGVALGYACTKRHGVFRGAVLAVHFQTVVRGVRDEGDLVYLDDHSIQPSIVGVCYVPSTYRHI